MFTSKKTNRKSLGFQCLEERRLMAGDVAVYPFGGALVIEGDDVGNALQITQYDNGTYQVSGLWTDGGLTKINGSYSSDQFSGDITDLEINLRGGDDKLYVNYSGTADLEIDGDLNIRTGGGDDYVKIQNATVKGNVNIETDNGSQYQLGGVPADDDQVILKSVIAHDDMSIATGGGEDEVRFEAFTMIVGDNTNYPRYNVADQLTIDTGLGTDQDDTVDMFAVFAHEWINIMTGEGDDVVKTHTTAAADWYNIYTGAGDDSVQMENTYMNWSSIDEATSLYINTDSGNDTVELKNVDVRHNVMIWTGDGDDAIDMDDVQANDQIMADLGSGNDGLSVQRSSSAFADFDGGTNRRGLKGGDELSVVDSTFADTDYDNWEQTAVYSTKLQARPTFSR